MRVIFYLDMDVNFQRTRGENAVLTLLLLAGNLQAMLDIMVLQIEPHTHAQFTRENHTDLNE